MEDTTRTGAETPKLTEQQEKAFWSAVKIGIYRELHRKGLISDGQLSRLIAAQDR